MGKSTTTLQMIDFAVPYLMTGMEFIFHFYRHPNFCDLSDTVDGRNPAPVGMVETQEVMG